MEIIGAGRVGTALALLLEEQGLPVSLITRNSGPSSTLTGTPILVTVRNDDLSAVLEKVPENRRPDLVFIQNGMIRPWLSKQGLAENTRGLLFFAVSARGERPVPGPPSPFCGTHAAALVRQFHAIGLPAEQVSEDSFAQSELEKLVWNSAFGLLCQATGQTVGELVTQRTAEARALIQELADFGGRELDVVPAPGLVERCFAYSLEIPDYRGAVKDWAWRNGWFVARSQLVGTGLPAHSRWLVVAGIQE